MSVADELAEIPLVDQHCHPVVLNDPDREQFELMLSEANDLRPAGTTEFDTQVGLAVRRRSGPVLGLQPHAEPDEYLARRSFLGPEESSRRLLRACGGWCGDHDRGPPGCSVRDWRTCYVGSSWRVTVTRTTTVAALGVGVDDAVSLCARPMT